MESPGTSIEVELEVGGSGIRLRGSKAKKKHQLELNQTLIDPTSIGTTATPSALRHQRFSASTRAPRPRADSRGRRSRVHVSTPSYQIRPAASWPSCRSPRPLSLLLAFRVAAIYPASRLTAHNALDDTYTYTTTATMSSENTEPIPVPPPATDANVASSTTEPTPAVTTAVVASELEATPAAAAPEPTPAPVAEAPAKSEGAFPD